MKATDVIQPAVLSAPIAVNGSKDTIPQEQANALYPWYCSVENGFPDVTMQPLNSGGKPPRGQGMNGLLNVISDQKVYLQNGGVITFDSNVSNAIGGYPQGAILDYVTDSSVNKVISLIDDNTYNFVANPALIDGVHWQDISPLNKSQITNCILEAPNGVATYTTSGGTSTITAQEGLTVLIPNGRNADGTMNNITATVSNPVASQLTNATAITATIRAIILYNNSNQKIEFSNYPDYIISDDEPTSLPYSTATWFSPAQNKFYRTTDTGSTWTQKYYVPIATATLTFNNSTYAKITSLNTFETVDLLKRTDRFDISSWTMPSSAYEDLTLGASGSTYTAPAAGWVWINGVSTGQYGWVQAVSEVGNGQLARGANNAIQCYVPVRAGGTFRVWYNDINLDYFRFIYSIGVV